MTGLLIIVGFVFGLMALGHVILSMALALPFKGWFAATYWLLVGAAIAFWVAAFISQLAGVQ